MTTPRFLADAMVGKLARNLRALGYDAAYHRDADDDELLAKMRQDERVLLTRDTRLADRGGDQALLLVSRDPMEQLEATLDELDLAPDPDRFLTRCLDCNADLFPTHAPDEVPRDVEDEQHWECPVCSKTYWIGTHAKDMHDRLGHLLDDTPALLDPEG